MRQKLHRQIPIDPAAIVGGSAQVDHPHAGELKRISDLLDARPEVLDRVFADLAMGQGDTALGRPAMSADQALRAALLKQMHGLSYDRLAFSLADSISFRRFLRLGAGQPSPKRASLQDNIKKISAEAFEAVNRALLDAAEEMGIEDGSAVRVDCTTVDANIHHPTDNSLLWDAVRVLSRLIVQARRHFGTGGVDRHRRAKKLAHQISNAKSFKQMEKPYRDLLKVLQLTVEDAQGVLDDLRKLRIPQRKKKRRARYVEHLANYLPLARRVGDQTHRRVVLEEQVPAREKLVSLFEPHADIIIKDNRNTHYGHKVCLTGGRSNLILDALVLEGNPADAHLAAPMVTRQTDLYGRVPKQAAFDGGFASKANIEQLKRDGVLEPMFHARAGIRVEDMVDSRKRYVELRDFRAGLEAGISFLKRCFGLTRCTWRSWESFRAYVWASIVAANLLILARAAPG